jgi:hypothetical protein
VVGKHGGPAGNHDCRVPELCLVIGPNTRIGHNSMVYIIESQLSCIDDYVAAFRRATRRLNMADYDVLPAGGGR